MSISMPLLSRRLPSPLESQRILCRRIAPTSPNLNLLLRFPPIELPIPPRRLSARPGFPAGRNLRLGFCSRATANGEAEPSDVGADEGSKEEEEDESKWHGALPPQLRYLTKEVPERLPRWPWLIVLFFLIYAWRSVLWELSNWKKAVLAIVGFFVHLLKHALARMFHFIGGLIRAPLSFVWSVYASIVADAPIQELSTVIILASIMMAIAEATVPDSVNSQPYILSLGGLIGFLAVDGTISELLFWLLLSGLYCYNRFIKKKDDVSAALPMAATAAAVGEPWVRLLAITSFLALAIRQHSKSSGENAEMEAPFNSRRLPLPLLFSALAIGIHVAAKWIRCCHLTWKAL